MRNGGWGRTATAVALVTTLVTGCGSSDGGGAPGAGADGAFTGDPDVAVITEDRTLLVTGKLVSDGTERLWLIGGDDLDLFQLEPSIEAPVATLADTGTIVTSMAWAGDQIWVSTLQAGLAETGSVVRVDPDRGEIVSSVESPAVPSTLAPADDAMWLTGSSRDHFTGALLRVDPGSDAVEVVETYDWGGTDLASSGDSLWYPSPVDPGIDRFDIASRTTVTTIPLLSTTFDVAVLDGRVWATQGGQDGRGAVVRIDPETNQVDGNVDLDAQPSDLAFAAGSLWILARPGGGSGTYTYDPSTTTTTAPPEDRRTQLVRVDPDALEVTGAIDLPYHASDLEVLGDTIWVFASRTGDEPARLLKVDPA